jgi:hypothetical protein
VCRAPAAPRVCEGDPTAERAGRGMVPRRGVVDIPTVKTVPLVLVTAAGALLLAAPAFAGGPRLSIGVVDDAVKQRTVKAATAKMALVRRAGFDAVEVTEPWTQGESKPPAGDVVALRNVFSAARSLGMHVIVDVFPSGSSQTPVTADEDDRFAAFAVALARSVRVRELVVGNEPNLNRFWLPQFGPDGSDAAAPAYLQLLETTYDALKAFDARIVVVGGALSPRGSDRPGPARQTHSPTAFIEDMGRAYRASGRSRPVMDALDIHPYEDSSSVAPEATHPKSTTISIADYPKLVTLLAQAFDGTAQPGSALPIVYGEFGVEGLAPLAEADLYAGTEPAATKPVDPITQGRYYAQAIAIAASQPNVRALMLFHAFDEPNRAGWQSGVYYANGAPKASLPIVRRAIEDMRRGAYLASSAPHVVRQTFGSRARGSP